MIIEQADLVDVENLLKAMRRVSFSNFSGAEVLAFARAFALLNDAYRLAKEPRIEIKKELKKK